MKKVSFLIITVSLAFDLYGQVGINTDSEKASLNIKELSNQSENTILRSKNSSDNDILQVMNNGNVTIYNDLKFNNNSGTLGNILRSNGTNKSPVWSNAVEKGILLQVFNAVQNEFNPAEYSIGTASKRFSNPIVHSDVEAEIGVWDKNKRDFTVLVPGLYEINVGGNFYLNLNLNDNPNVGVSIVVYEQGNSEYIYQVQGNRSLVQNSPTFNLTLDDGKIFNANLTVYSSASISLILKKNDRIVVSYATAGYSTTNLVPFKIFYNITYTELPQ